MTEGRGDRASSSVVTDGRMELVRGQNILFSASRRAIFSLNDTAADIWRRLEAGQPPEAISQWLASQGLDPQEAHAHVGAAIGEWERLGLIRPEPPPAPAASPEFVSQVVGIAGVRVRIVYPAAVAYPAATIFGHLEVESDSVDVLLQLVAHGERLHLFRNGEWLQHCSDVELPTTLKGQLLSEALDHASYELALHAACLVRNDRVLLLCGSPGAGKTTLSMALVNAGFGFAGDDVTLLDSAGRGIGLPFAPAIKAGSWPILAGFRPDLATAPVFRRPDRKRVRYPVPERLVAPSPRAIGWVMLLRRDSKAKASLELVDPAGALRGLLNGAYALGGELSASGFGVLAQVIGSAEVCCLTYSTLEDAVSLIGETCR